MHDWPDIPYEPWRQTCEALHLYAQIVGKYRLANTPWVNHSWHATFYVNARGITTSMVPDGPGMEIELDLLRHRVVGTTFDGRQDEFALEPMSVAEFHRRFIALLRKLGGHTKFSGRPSEIPGGLPFAEDDRPRPYDADAVTRYYRALVNVNRVFTHFRTGYLGKVSPVHLFWGALDLAVTRFSGESAPLHAGGIPARAVAASTTRPSILMPIPRRTASPPARQGRMRPSTTKRWGSSSCLTTMCAVRRTLRLRFWNFSKAHTIWRPTSANGHAGGSNVRWAFPCVRAQFDYQAQSSRSSPWKWNVSR